MKILISTEQLNRIILTEQEKKCIPTLPAKWKKINYSLNDVLNGKILHYGEQDLNNLNALKLIQRRLNTINGEHFPIDGKYGPNILTRLAKFLGVDLCKQKNNDIPIGPKTLTKLGLNFEIGDNNRENYILASTLIGENISGTKDELVAILSTIKNRSKKCNKTMEEMVLLPRQYSTWDHYNRLDDDEKIKELFTRIANQKSKTDFNKILKIVEQFKLSDPLPYNHYVNKTLKNVSLGTDSLSTSYKKNKKSAKQIGLHTFWWDKKHRCN